MRITWSQIPLLNASRDHVTSSVRLLAADFVSAFLSKYMPPEFGGTVSTYVPDSLFRFTDQPSAAHLATRILCRELFIRVCFVSNRFRRVFQALWRDKFVGDGIEHGATGSRKLIPYLRQTAAESVARLLVRVSGIKRRRVNQGQRPALSSLSMNALSIRLHHLLITFPPHKTGGAKGISVKRKVAWPILGLLVCCTLNRG